MRFFPHSSAFFSASAAKAAGGYNQRIGCAEDWRLWPELALRGELACLDRPLVRIRKHPGQMSLDDNRKTQLCDTVADLVCHFLKKSGHKDPSSSDCTESEWLEFRDWVRARTRASGFIRQREVWCEARDEYMRGGPARALRFISRLAGSGYAVPLFIHKFFGTSLPRELAELWVRRPGGGEP